MSPEGFLHQHMVVGWLVEVEVVEVMEQSVSLGFLDTSFVQLLQPLPVDVVSAEPSPDQDLYTSDTKTHQLILYLLFLFLF